MTVNSYLSAGQRSQSAHFPK